MFPMKKITTSILLFIGFTLSAQEVIALVCKGGLTQHWVDESATVQPELHGTHVDYPPQHERS
jgi:hypothetical protein